MRTRNSLKPEFSDRKGNTKMTTLEITTLDLALLVIRVVLGITFVLHGGQKLFGWYGGAGIKGTRSMMQNLGVAHPGLLGWMAALSEAGGGLFVLIGLVTPLAAALIISIMLVAIYTVHWKNGFFNGNRGYEFNLSLIALAVTLILTGAGLVSVDHLLGAAVPLNLLPAWAILIIAVVLFGGIAMTVFSRRVKDLHQNAAQ
jgi:putative oxidoreductase